EASVVRRERNGERDVGEQALVARVGRELALGVVLAVWRLEAHRQAEGPPVFGRQELQGLVAHLLREVRRVVLGEITPLAGEAAPVVELLLRHLFANSELADEAGAVAGLPQ